MPAMPQRLLLCQLVRLVLDDVRLHPHSFSTMRDSPKLAAATVAGKAGDLAVPGAGFWCLSRAAGPGGGRLARAAAQLRGPRQRSPNTPRAGSSGAAPFPTYP